MDKPKKAQGMLKISKNVLASIAEIATLEIQGVTRLADSAYNLPTVISRKMPRQSISINLNDDWAEVEISIIIDFGVNIPNVCAKIQHKVKDNIQTMTGIIVPKVNINVAGISLPEENPIILNNDNIIKN